MQRAEQLKQVADTASIGTVVATIIGWLPEATAVLSFLWMCIRIYETRTVQGIIARLRERVQHGG